MFDLRFARNQAGITICVPTYKRPVLLARLLENLAHALVLFTQESNWLVEVLVVDNDPLKSALATVEEAKKKWGINITYLLEARTGLSYVRNTAVRNALQKPHCQWVVFIDDDEFPARSWLLELFLALQKSEASIATGPIKPFFEVNPSGWILRGRFFERRRHVDLEVVSYAYARTSNVAIAREVFEKIGFFDENLNLKGGEDTDFFYRATQAGFTIVWADKAVVYEYVPKERQTLRWLLLRGFRTSQTMLYIASKYRGIRGVLLELGKASVRLVLGIGIMPLALLGALAGRKEYIARALLWVARGLGPIWAIMGMWYEEYAHGRS